jgi:hypothetical protein
MTQVCGRTATVESFIPETRRSGLANPTTAEQPKVKKQYRTIDRTAESRAVNRVCTALNRRSGVECRVTTSPDELFAAFRLVYEQYQRSGLMNPNKCGMRITPYHLLPTTEVLVALEGSKLTCTMSLVCDSEKGLPMEAVYPDEIAGLRLKGLSLAEVSCFAESQDEGDSSQSAVFQLMPLMAQLAYRRGADVLLIAVRPRHARFYQRFLGFDAIAEERSHGRVCGTRGVALAADLNRLAVNHPRVHEWMFGEPFSHAALGYKPLSAELLEEMQTIVEVCFEGLFACDRTLEMAIECLSSELV